MSRTHTSMVASDPDTLDALFLSALGCSVSLPLSPMNSTLCKEFTMRPALSVLVTKLSGGSVA